MAGIYIHIPFCKQACSYCNFHFSTSLKNKDALIEALRKELVKRKNYLSSTVSSIYFGGGTPSLLNQEELSIILEDIYLHFQVQENVEITLEANPDDLRKEKLSQLKKSGINRLSIGVQSFHDKDLQFMDRTHSATEAIKVIRRSQDTGFENINIDLIFGAHSTSDEDWLRNLDQFFDLNLPHLSAYSLTVEENTKLIHQISKGKLNEVDDEKAYRQYMLLQDAIDKNGFEQYELSNYCKNSQYSKHNSSYWNQSPYLGIGPSAHSFNGSEREWNIANNSLYIKQIEQGAQYSEKEMLTEKDRYHDYLITRLRTTAGIDFQSLESLFSKKIVDHFHKQKTRINPKMLRQDDSTLKLKREILFQSDEVIRSLMMDEE